MKFVIYLKNYLVHNFCDILYFFFSFYFTLVLVFMIFLLSWKIMKIPYLLHSLFPERMSSYRNWTFLLKIHSIILSLVIWEFNDFIQGNFWYGKSYSHFVTIFLIFVLICFSLNSASLALFCFADSHWHDANYFGCVSYKLFCFMVIMTRKSIF